MDNCPHCKRPMACDKCGRDLTKPLPREDAPWMGERCRCGARISARVEEHELEMLRRKHDRGIYDNEGSDL